jgi:hypothetical protein
MGYSNFKRLKQVTQKFGLDAKTVRLFPDIKSAEPSSWLQETLEKARLFPLINEKVKSEKIVSPILSEVAEWSYDKVTLFSGEELPVDAENDLSGECDFFFVLAPYKPYIESPIISVVEAKDEDMDYGTAQCAAQLYGAKLYNESEGKNIPILYGCATDGFEWKFLRFENNIFLIDNKVYTDLREILGVFQHIIQSF